MKLPHVNKKPLARQRIFVQTRFSYSTLNLKRKNFTPQKHSLFRSTSCFGVTKITTPIWLQKSWKCVNRSLKKRQRPNTIQILWIVKNQEHRNIATLSLQLRSYNNVFKLRLISPKLANEITSATNMNTNASTKYRMGGFKRPSDKKNTGKANNFAAFMHTLCKKNWKEQNNEQRCLKNCATRYAVYSKNVKIWRSYTSQFSAKTDNTRSFSIKFV